MNSKTAGLFFNRYDEEKFRVILSTLTKKGSVPKTHLQYRAELTNDRFNRILTKLFETGMITTTKQTVKNRYQYPMIQITANGKKLLDKYNRLSSLIDWTITGTGRN